MSCLTHWLALIPVPLTLSLIISFASLAMRTFTTSDRSPSALAESPVAAVIVCVTKLYAWRSGVKYNDAMSKHIAPAYWPFYLEGRAEKLLKHQISESDLVDQLLSERNIKSLHEILNDACQNTAKPLENGKVRREWIDAHENDVRETVPPTLMATRTDDAFLAWLQGRVDELYYALTPCVVEELQERFAGDDEEDDEEDENDDDDDEEGDDDDDDDEEPDVGGRPARTVRPPRGRR